MFCRNLAEAAAQAKANADHSGEAWVFFADTSGNARAEKRPDLTGLTGREVVIVQPHAP